MQYCLLKSVCEMSQLVPNDRARQPPATNIDATTNDTGGIAIAGFRANASVQTALAEVESRKVALGGAVVCCIMNRLNSGARSDLQSHLGACLIYRTADLILSLAGDGPVGPTLGKICHPYWQQMLCLHSAKNGH
jgi:hypothetical protein